MGNSSDEGAPWVRHDAQWQDAQWAQHLGPQSSPGGQLTSLDDEGSSRRPTHDAGAQSAGAGSDMLNIQSEISALRPRPSDLPPEPTAHSERVRASRKGKSTKNFRTKTPSDLSVLFQVSAVNSSVAKRAEQGPRPLVQPGSRGYLPKSPLEFLPPPPPPTRRISGADFGRDDLGDDEMPTQARRPASVPPFAQNPGHRSAIVPPPAPPAPRMAERAGARVTSSVPAAAFGVALPQLPPPPALPAGFTRSDRAVSQASRYEPASYETVENQPASYESSANDSSSYESWDEREWTGAHAAALRAPAVPSGLVAQSDAASGGGVLYSPPPPGVRRVDSSRPNPMHGAQDSAARHHAAEYAAAEYPGADSVRPISASVPPGTSGLLPSGWLPVAGASVMGAALSAGAFMLPQHGQLLVDVSNQSWASLGNVQIFVDGELACTQSPCAVKVDADNHRVQAIAPGYQPSQEESVLVTDDSVTLHKIQLGASADTGIDVQTAIPNLQLYIDGRRVGSLPRKVMGLPPGEHTVLVSGGEDFTSEERRVLIEPNQILAISDLIPKLKAGSLDVSAGSNAEGASVMLDGKHVSLPYKAHLTPGQEYRLTAQREGFQAFEKTFTVDANNPAASFKIMLTPVAVDAHGALPNVNVTSSRNRTAPGRVSPRMTRAEAVAKALGEAPPANNESERTESRPAGSNDALGAAMRQSVGLPADAPEEAAPKAVGKGFLNIVTTPSALVVIDGKPVGRTPRRVAVTAGTHSVVLVHTNGRKRTAVDVDEGGTKTIKASF